MAAPVGASELNKLVTTAAESAKAAEDADKAQQGRCLDVLKHMQKLVVSAAVLKETDAGKKVNKLTKSSIAEIAAAAAKVVQCWKDCVKRQAQEAGGTLTTATSQPDFGSQLSLGTSTSIGTSAKQAMNGDAASKPSLPQQPLSQTASQPKRPSQTASQPKRPIASTGDPKRDKIRKLFCDGLSLVPDDQRQGQDPAEVAAAVEAALFSKYGGQTGAEYSSKVRTLSFNFKDPNNPDLRARVVTRALDPQDLLNLSAEELASDQKRQLNHKIRQEAAAEAVRGFTTAASTDMFQCGRCKQRKCTYYQMQTRSADEPMTTFVTCTHCGNKWKFC